MLRQYDFTQWRIQEGGRTGPGPPFSQSGWATGRAGLARPAAFLTTIREFPSRRSVALAPEIRVDFAEDSANELGNEGVYYLLSYHCPQQNTNS